MDCKPVQNHHIYLFKPVPSSLFLHDRLSISPLELLLAYAPVWYQHLWTPKLYTIFYEDSAVPWLMAFFWKYCTLLIRTSQLHFSFWWLPLPWCDHLMKSNESSCLYRPLSLWQRFLLTILTYIDFHLCCWNLSYFYCSNSRFCLGDTLNFLCADGNIDDRSWDKSLGDSTWSLSPGQHLLFERYLTSFLFLPVPYAYHTSSLWILPISNE